MNNGRRFRRSIHVSTWASQDEKRSTEVLVDDYSPLVQPTMHTVVEEELEPGRL